VSRAVRATLALAALTSMGLASMGLASMGLVSMGLSTGRAMAQEPPPAGDAPQGTETSQPAGTDDASPDTHAASRRDAPAPSVEATAAPVAAVVEAAPAPAPEENGAPLGVPDDLGLPLEVHVGVAFLELRGVDENEGTFDATLDARITWIDRSLAYPPASHPAGWLSYRDEEAETRLATMWEPHLRFANMAGEPAYTARGLRIGPRGEVELIVRTTASFHATFDVERFPFDRQGLTVEIVADRAPREHVSLVFRQADLDYTRVARGAEADGWHARSVDLSRQIVAGWHGESHDSVHATLTVARDAAVTAAPIFIPLLASLLIPLLAIWLNKLEEGEFKIEAFELANVIVGGLFAVIALNFTVSSELGTLAGGDNTVSRLFSLNYLTLATALLVNLLVFRYRLLRTRFGPFVEEEMFRVITWAVPTFAFATALAFVLVAYA
jgi:hypothetical protein